MDLVLVGLSHKTAPVDVRERISFGEDRLKDAAHGLHEHCGLRENLILSTCNRVEILAHHRDSDAASRAVSHFLHDHHQLNPAFLDQYLYQLDGLRALRHVFRVASSLDSMVLGESQILGQLKSAYSQAKDHGFIGSNLS